MRLATVACFHAVDDVFVHPTSLALQEPPGGLESNISIERVDRIVAVRIRRQINAFERPSSAPAPGTPASGSCPSRCRMASGATAIDESSHEPPGHSDSGV